MNFDELRVRYGWFKEHVEELQKMAEIMDCLGQEISCINFEVNEPRFHALSQPHADLRAQLTTEPKSLQGGVRTMEHYEEMIRETATSYLLQEADNEQTAQQITVLLEQDGFTED